MQTPDLLSQVSTERVVTIVAFLAAVFERFRSRKKEIKSEAEKDLLSDAKRLQERAELLGRLADDNASNFKKEQEEHQKTRLFWHNKASDFQADLARCQERMTELQERPDYSEIVEQIKVQSQTNHEILEAIRQVVNIVKINYEYISHSAANTLPSEKNET